jgi:hypothetical protein
MGIARRTAGPYSLLSSGECLGASGAGLLENVDMLNKDGGLSLDPALVLVLWGGGGKTGFDDSSGDDLYILAGDSRVAGDMPGRGSSLAMVDVR